MRWCHNALHAGFCHVVSGILKSALLLLSCMHKITLVYQRDQRASGLSVLEDEVTPRSNGKFEIVCLWGLEPSSCLMSVALYNTIYLGL